MSGETLGISEVCLFGDSAFGRRGAWRCGGTFAGVGRDKVTFC